MNTLARDSDDFRVALWNVDHNGIENNGNQERWEVAMSVLAEIRPHVVLRNELTRADNFGERAVWAEANALGGLIPFLAPASPESVNPTGVFVDPSLIQPVAFFKHVVGMWHPICQPVVRLAGAPRPLTLAAFHLCPFDGDQRATEARRLATLGGAAAIIGGDRNSYPHRTDLEKNPLPDWSNISDRRHVQHRTIDRAGERVHDTRPDEILAGEHDGPPVFVDLAYYAATELGQSDALEPTASLWRTDQGPRQRIDSIYATPLVATALRELKVISDERVVKASDHALLVADFSLSALCAVLTPEGVTAA
ncbi:endonuclease/exonuclease/phosphatase family protein [Streptomyces sp. NPDC002547]